MAKINDTQRLEIMTRLLAGEAGNSLAREYFLSPTHISRLKKQAERDLLAITDKRLKQDEAA